MLLLGIRWFVFHISVMDPLSSCHCLLSCLDELRVWSDLNPMHHIIFMDIELKLTGDFFRVSEVLRQPVPAGECETGRSISQCVGRVVNRSHKFM